MKILITGIPGVGKSEISKTLAKQKKFKVFNDKEYSIKNKLGNYEKADGIKEYFVELKKLNAYSRKDLSSKDNIIFEGHLWCELSKSNLKLFDKVIVLTADSKIIRQRLEKRKYRQIKIEENLFCQDNKYIPELLKKKSKKYIIIKTNNNIKQNIKKISEKLW